MESFKMYVQESYNELINNVTWPTFSNLQSDTVVVIIATIVFSLVIFGMDTISNLVLSAIYGING